MAEAVRLCPHCANSVGIGATKCPYCKANLESTVTPQWPTREGESMPSHPALKASRVSMLAKIVLVAGVAALALGVYLVVGQRGRSESQLLLEAKLKELQEKEQKISTLEAEAAKTRQTLTEQTGQLSELKAKLEESQKELASVRVRLGLTNREVDRLASSRSQPARQTASRPPDPAPQPVPAPTRRAAEAGVYETIRATSVYEEPSGSSRVLSQIVPGTRINVVRSIGDWLEVRSKQGNPPGFIRLADAKFTGRAN
jgi:DNA-binding protein H-NS